MQFTVRGMIRATAGGRGDDFHILARIALWRAWREASEILVMGSISSIMGSLHVLGFGSQDEYGFALREWHGSVRAKMRSSGAGDSGIKQACAFRRRGQKGRLVSKAAAAQKREEASQVCWCVMARILL